MTKNEIAYALVKAKAKLTKAEEAYSDLCSQYLKAGGQTMLIESLDTKINVITPKRANIDSEALAKHLIKMGKVKELAASAKVNMAVLAKVTDKAFAAKMEAKFGNEEEGEPFIKVTAA